MTYTVRTRPPVPPAQGGRTPGERPPLPRRSPGAVLAALRGAGQVVVAATRSMHT